MGRQDRMNRFNFTISSANNCYLHLAIARCARLPARKHLRANLNFGVLSRGFHVLLNCSCLEGSNKHYVL